MHDLPATSQVLFEVLELCQQPNSSSQQLAASIMLDPVLCATLLSMTADQITLQNSEPGILVQVVERMGKVAVQSATLDIARRFCQQPQSAEQRILHFRLWRRMILTAKLSHALALLTNYGNPGEAYLAGLLEGVGRLRVLAAGGESSLSRLSSDAQTSAERSQLSRDHSLWAYRLVKAWGMPGFLADALRYQAYSVEQVADAHPLVCLCSLAGRLASSRFEVVNQGLDMARLVYGINSSECEEVLSQAGAATRRAEVELAIPEHSDDSAAMPLSASALGSLVDDLLQIQTICNSLRADESAGLEPHVLLAKVLNQSLGCKQYRILIHDAAEHRLLGFSDGRNALLSCDAAADWRISLQPARSAMALSFAQGASKLIMSGAELPSVADQQMLEMLEQPAALCLPVTVDAGTDFLVVAGGGEEAMGALVVRARYLLQLREILASLNTARREGSAEPGEEVVVAEGRDVRVSEIIHEVSNPLSIIGNYLGILQHKLAQGDHHYGELDIMGEELDRAVKLMRDWGAPSLHRTVDDVIDINPLVARLLQVYGATMFDPMSIELALDLDCSPVETHADAGAVQQILRNLLSNAIEAVAPGGHIQIETRSAVYMDSGAYAVLIVGDDGPGIASEVRKNIFNPVSSTKGDGHSGLGLSIVKSLVDNMQGKIVFRTGAKGTEFQVYLPK